VGLSLDIGCGAHKHPGELGVDRRSLPGVAVVCDFEQGLPFKEGSVTMYASREAFVDPTHVRYITEATVKYFDYPNYYGLKTNFKIRSTNFKMRNPCKFMAAYFQKRFRRYLWNA
jgi:hypothetical protein